MKSRQLRESSNLVSNVKLLEKTLELITNTQSQHENYLAGQTAIVTRRNDNGNDNTTKNNNNTDNRKSEIQLQNVKLNIMKPFQIF